MNPVLHWLTSPEWSQAVKALLHSLWQGGVLALLLGLALRHVFAPEWRYRLTLGALGGLLLASLFTWAVLNQIAGQSDFQAAVLKEEIALIGSSSPQPVAQNDPLIVTITAKPSSEVVTPSVQWTAWTALVWLLGAVLMLARAGLQVAGAERLRRSGKPLADPGITQLLAETQRAIRLVRKVRVTVTDTLTSPAVVGVLVPTLILPLSLLTTLTHEQLRFVLLHELAHIRRGDYFTNLFQLFVEALLFFNPAVWWISQQVRREREACCDALAIELSGAPAEYARTLVHVAESALNPSPAAAAAFGDKQREPSSLSDRVQRLLVPGYRPALRLTWRAMLLSLVVGGTLLILSASGTRNTVGAILANEKVRDSNAGAPKANDIPQTLSAKPLAQPDPAQTNATEARLPFDVQAGNMNFDSATRIYTASNGVVIKHEGIVITADLARIDLEVGEVVAEGNARLSNHVGVMAGDRITFNYRTGQAKAEQYSREKKGNPPPVSTKQPPPQISIQVRCVEITQDDNRVNGFDWYLGNFLLANGAITNSFWKKMWPFTGILTDSQLRVVLRAFEERGGADILTAPPLTTPSGRQAQIQIMEPQTAAPGINPKVPAPIRLALDLIPSVSADGNTIQMTLIPRIGHDESGKDAPIGNSLSPPGTNSPLPLPRTRLVQVTASAVVRDGQTMVLDLTSELDSKDKPRRLIFVTPRLIDAAGNPLHSDAELQSGENTLLPQPVCQPQEPAVPTRRILPENVVQDSVRLLRFSTNNFAVRWTYTEAGAKAMLVFNEAHQGRMTRIAIGSFLSLSTEWQFHPMPPLFTTYAQWKEGWLKHRGDKILSLSEADAKQIVETLRGK